MPKKITKDGEEILVGYAVNDSNGDNIAQSLSSIDKAVPTDVQATEADGKVTLKLMHDGEEVSGQTPAEFSTGATLSIQNMASYGLDVNLITSISQDGTVYPLIYGDPSTLATEGGMSGLFQGNEILLSGTRGEGETYAESDLGFFAVNSTSSGEVSYGFTGLCRYHLADGTIFRTWWANSVLADSISIDLDFEYWNNTSGIRTRTGILSTGPIRCVDIRLIQGNQLTVYNSSGNELMSFYNARIEFNVNSIFIDGLMTDTVYPRVANSVSILDNLGNAVATFASGITDLYGEVELADGNLAVNGNVTANEIYAQGIGFSAVIAIPNNIGVSSPTLAVQESSDHSFNVTASAYSLEGFSLSKRSLMMWTVEYPSSSVNGTFSGSCMVPTSGTVRTLVVGDTFLTITLTPATLTKEATISFSLQQLVNNSWTSIAVSGGYTLTWRVIE